MTTKPTVGSKPNRDLFRRKAQIIADRDRTDILALSGVMDEAALYELRAAIPLYMKRPQHLMVLLESAGGNFPAAAAIANCVQDRPRFNPDNDFAVTVLIAGPVQGAGVLVALAGDVHQFGPYSELGSIYGELEEPDYDADEVQLAARGMRNARFESRKMFEAACLVAAGLPDHAQDQAFRAAAAAAANTLESFYSTITPALSLVANEASESIARAVQSVGSRSLKADQTKALYDPAGFSTIRTAEEARPFFRFTEQTTPELAELVELLGWPENPMGPSTTGPDIEYVAAQSIRQAPKPEKRQRKSTRLKLRRSTSRRR